jgi:hypothetical protein
MEPLKIGLTVAATVIVLGLAPALPANPARAQEPPPVVFGPTPERSDCTVPPRPTEDFVKPPETSRIPPSVGSEADLPPGQPADEATVAAIAAVEWQITACEHAGEFRRAYALYTEAFLAIVLAALEVQDLREILATPTPLPPHEQLPVLVRDVRVLPDGRVGAVVDRCLYIRFFIYQRVNGQWLVDGAIIVERTRVSCKHTDSPEEVV